MTRATYLIALGSNRRSRHGSPAQAIAAALAAVGSVVVAAPVIASAPLGPSIRRFANTAVLVESEEEPPALLARLKAIERRFGRRRGQRWGARTIDLDIILWSGGEWRSGGKRSQNLDIPHIAFRERTFVLGPAVRIAPGWRDPVTGLTLRQLAWRLTRPRGVPRSQAVDGGGP